MDKNNIYEAPELKRDRRLDRGSLGGSEGEGGEAMGMGTGMAPNLDGYINRKGFVR